MKYPEHYTETTPIQGEQAEAVREAIENGRAFTNENALALFERIMKREAKQSDGEEAEVRER